MNDKLSFLSSHNWTSFWNVYIILHIHSICKASLISEKINMKIEPLMKEKLYVIV